MTAYFQRNLEINLGSRIKIRRKGIPTALRNRIYDKLIFVNPRFQKRHKNGGLLGTVSSHIKCIQENHQHVYIPRGFFYQLIYLCRRQGIRYRVVDSRGKYETVEMVFHGELKDYQEEAFRELLRKDFGILVGGPKTGKKIITLSYIAYRSVPAIIIVPHQSVLKDWEKKVHAFLQLDNPEVKVLNEGKVRLGSKVTIAHASTIQKHVKKLRNRFGLVVVDDCNYCPSRFFTGVMPHFNSLYSLGLAGSTVRKDGLSRLMYFYVGDIIHIIEKERVYMDKSLVQAEVRVRETPFQFSYSGQNDFPALMESLMLDNERQSIIVEDILGEIRKRSGPVLVLCGGNVQCQSLSKKLRAGNVRYKVVDVKATRKELKEAESEFERGELDVLVAPLVVIARGLRLRKVKALFLGAPICFKGEIANFLKSLNSGDPGDRVKIYDYVDTRVGILKNIFRVRSYSYGMRSQPSFLDN